MRLLVAFVFACLTLSAQQYDWLRVVPGSSHCPREDKDGERAMLGRRGSATTEAWVKPNEERVYPLAERKSGGTFGFTDEGGRLTTLDALKGKVVVVAFFSTACEPSMRMLVEIAQLQPKGPQFGFELLPVHLESWVNIGQMTRRWADVKPVRFFRAGLGSSGPLQLGPELSALPTVYVLDREGRVAHAYVGFMENRLSGVLRRYLAEKPATPPTAPKPGTE